VKSRAEVERQLAAVAAAQRIAGEEPTVEDMEAARRILMGEATTEQVIAEGLAELEAQYGFKR
jgi:predicted phage gp36 major capsid-like protein